MRHRPMMLGALALAVASLAPEALATSMDMSFATGNGRRRNRSGHSPKNVKHATDATNWIVQRAIDKRERRGLRLCAEGR